jgi:uncharacterized protein YecE (DUF72 family)
VYYRLHGSPEMYRSPYTTDRLGEIATDLAKTIKTANSWCIFDNTTLGAATGDALTVLEKMAGRGNAERAGA